jgi:hypothetical protein
MAKEKTTETRSIAQKYYKAKDFLVGLNYKELYEKGMVYARAFYKDVRFKLNDLNNTNYELAVYHYNQGNLPDARFRFWFYSKFWHDRVEVDYFKGRLYYEGGDFEKAVPCS